MNSLKKELNIQSFQVNLQKQLTVQTLLELFQEMAWLHAESKHFGWNDLHQINQLWVISKFHIKINQFPEWMEHIQLETWGKLCDKYIAYRDFELKNAENKLLIYATSSWLILDNQTFKIQNLDHFISNFEPWENRHAIPEKPSKIEPIALKNKSHIQEVKYSDLDMNQHVNNTKYIQWIIDDMRFDFLNTHQLSEIEINYLHQAKYGDSYSIYHQQTESSYIHSIFCENIQKELVRVKTKWNQIQS